MADTDKTNADKRLADDKKKLAAEREHRAKVQAEHQEMMVGTPTPTQEEADLIKLGHHPDLAPDGSTDPYNTEQAEASGTSGKPYSNRQMTSERQSGGHQTGHHQGRTESKSST